MAHSIKPIAAVLGAAFLASSFVPAASASSNPFSAQQLRGDYDLASDGKDAEGSCGENKAEGKCGEGKCGAGKESCLSPTEGWREPVSG